MVMAILENRDAEIAGLSVAHAPEVAMDTIGAHPRPIAQEFKAAAGGSAITRKITLAILGLCLTVYLVGLFQLALHGPYDPDELEAIHTAWKMAQGERIYLDFFQNHHEGLYILLLPFIHIWGDSLAAMQAIAVFVFGLFLLQLWLTYLIAAHVFNREIGLLSAMLLSANLVFWEAMNIRPDSPQTLFGLIAVYIFLVHQRRPGIGKLLLSAVSLAVSFLFLQKAIFLVFLLGCIQLALLLRKKMKPTHFIGYWAGFAAVLAPYFLHHFLHTTWTTYWTCNWLFNLKYTVHLSAHTVNKFLLSSYLENMVMLIFFVAGLWNCLKDPPRRMLAFLAVGLFAFSFKTNVLGPQYFMMALPFMAIVAATVPYALMSANRGMGLTAMICLCLLPARVAYLNSHTDARESQWLPIEAVLKNTTPEDRVYDGLMGFNVFRKDLDYFWITVEPFNQYLRTYRQFAPYDYDLLALIDTCKPKIISSAGIPDMQDPRIANHYVPLPEMDDLWIRKPDEAARP
jgi:hypothetical protein